MTRLGYTTVAIVIAAAGLLMPPSVFAQDPRGGAGNHPGSNGSPGGAVHSGGAVSSPGGSFGSGSGSGDGSSSSPSPNTSGWGSSGSDRRGNGTGAAVTRWRDINRHYGTESGTDGNRWYSRSRGDREPIGKAIGRGDVRPGGPSYPGDQPRWDEWGYAYSNRTYYNNCGPMYGFGGYRMGYFFYDPMWWSWDRGFSPCSPLGYGSYGYGYGGTMYGGYAGYPGYGSGYGSGYGYGTYGGSPFGAYGYDSGYTSSVSAAGLKLKVKPNDAQVFVDGYFAGRVDEFDGVFQRLPLNPGQHHIEVRAEGYISLTFDVSAEPYQTIKYRGELKRTR
jgi:hypothetical protein